MRFVRLLRLAVSIPLWLYFPLIYYLTKRIEIKETSIFMLNLITDRDYGYGVSGKRFLLALVMVALIVITIFLLLTTGRGES